MRRSPSTIASALLALILATSLPRSACAVEAIDVRVVDGGSSGLARKLRAEAAFAGFTPVGGAGEGLRARTASARPLATLHVISARRVELVVERASDGARFDLTIVKRPGEDESFALRVVEQLRARLVDVGWTIPDASTAAESASRAELGATGGDARSNAPAASTAASANAPRPNGATPNGAAATAPDTSTTTPSLAASIDGVSSAADAPIARNDRTLTDATAGLAPPDDAGPERDRASTEAHAASRHPPVRLWLDAGAAGSLVQGGLAVTPHAALGARVDFGSTWSANVLSLWPLGGDELQAAEGSAEARWTGFVAGVERRLAVPEPWFAGIGLGAGLFVLEADGQAQDEFEGQDVRLYSGAYFAQLGAGGHLASWLRVRATVLAGSSTPRLVLRSDGRDLARLGPFFGSLGVAFEVSWPVAAAEEL